MAEQQATADTTSSSLRSIVDGASLFVIGDILYKGSAFVLNTLLARALGTNIYGVYTYAYMFVTVSSLLTNLGTDQAVLRYLPKYGDDAATRNWVVSISGVSSVLVSVLFGGVLYVGSPLLNSLTLSHPMFVDTLRIIAIMLPLDSAFKLMVGILRGVQLPMEQVLLQKILRPGARIVAVVIALGVGFTYINTLAALVIASAVTVCCGLYLVYDRTDLHFVMPVGPGAQSAESPRNYFSYSLPLTLSKAGKILYNRMDVFLVGMFFGSGVAGYYNISFLLSSAISLPLAGCNQLFAPIASSLYEDDNMSKLNDIFGTVTRWVFTVALLGALAVIMYAPDLLRLIGEDYVKGTPILMLFAIGQLVNALVGPSNYLLMMTDHQYVSFTNHWVFGVANVILNLILIKQFGIIGAAIATASILALLNLVRLLEIRRFEGLYPYSRSFYKPLVAGVGCVIALYIPTIYLSGLPLLILGGSTGAIVYAVILYQLGIEQTDIDFAREVFE